MTFHPIVKRDTPATTHDLSSCPSGHVACDPNWRHERRDTRLRYNHIRIDHRHVQLALKYTRLQQRKYNSYLRALMAPYYDMNFGPSEKIALKTRYSAYPKVVAGHDGNLRFLLLSTWRYYKGRSSIRLRDIGYQKICPHFELNYIGWRREEYCALQIAVIIALWNQDGKESTGACPCCGTDFAVQLSSDYLDLHVWQDFGPEGTPLDAPWDTHLTFPNWIEYQNCWFRGYNLYHEPGTIRKLYEPEAPEQAAKPRISFPPFPSISLMRRFW
ncbi:hypothetical protein F5B21DRAFT_487701 [Xylaria acuta]|nr:hypothetical protein F5B21DRAFT_487701 [Xylaria acuta]